MYYVVDVLDATCGCDMCHGEGVMWRDLACVESDASSLLCRNEAALAL